MIRIQQIKLNTNQKEDLEKEILRLLSLKKEDLLTWKIQKESLDARKKPDIKFIYTVDIEIKEETKKRKKLLKNPNILIPKDTVYQFPIIKEENAEKLKERPVIIGTGPAGLFCGLFLAKQGYQPLLLERGECVEKRCKTVETFWKENKLNLNSNVQFGEGGAGTFSDGKLNTLVKDVSGRNRKVLEIFVKAGASADILYKNKPHIGTDILCHVVKNIREEIISYGGEVRFESQVTNFFYTGEGTNQKIKAVEVNHKERIPCQVCVLAVGHSARDSVHLLYQQGIAMQAKTFAVGFRVQHPQKMINFAQYGAENIENIFPTADYKLTYQASNGRSVYSFCMCPGGYVVNASSEEQRLAVNGMSYQKRDGENANSAVIISVTPEDFSDTNPLAGIEFQRNLEHAAYQLGSGIVPIQLYQDFCQNRSSNQLGEVMPQIKGNYQFGNLRGILKEELNLAFLEAMEAFGQKIKGFNRPDTILAGIESRTSSPVRILRTETMETNKRGIYPCGEGAGYAGGITSAAMDGIKIAEAIAKQYLI